MLFNSLEYAILLSVVFVAYFGLAQIGALRLLVLLAASYLFYAWWSPYYLVLIIASSMLDYWVGGAMHHQRDERRRRRLLLVRMKNQKGPYGFKDRCVLHPIRIKKRVGRMFCAEVLSSYQHGAVSCLLEA